ncbi:MAG: hypothetical protein WCD18_06130, partial [Thermosynechococcaceae cyanobacterium]
LMLVRLRPAQNSQGGYTLVVTIAMLIILAALLVTYAVTSKVDNASSMSSAKSNTGFYTAEAGLNLRAKAIRNKFEGYNRPSGTSPTGWQACLDNTSSNDGSGDFVCKTESYAFKNSNAKDAYVNQIGVQSATTYVSEPTEPPLNPVSVVIPNGEAFAGLSAQEYRYDVMSVAQDNQKKPTAIVGMRFKSRLIPLFQFAAFYEQDMDVSIPPNMTLNGPVHSNNDLYLDAANSSTLAITGQVTTAGTLYRGAKIQNTCSGTVTVDDPKNPRALPCGGSRQSFATSDLTDWNKQIRVGIDTLETPDPGEFDASVGHRYWDSADLRIALNLATTPPTIEVRSQGDTNQIPQTNQLNGATCAPTQTQLTAQANAGDNALTVASSNNLKPGDIITLGPDPTSLLGTTGNSYVIESIPDSQHINLTQTVSATINSGTNLRKSVVSFSDETFRNYREKHGLNGAGRLDYTPIKLMNVDMQGLIGCAETLMGKNLDDDSDGGLVWFLTVKGPNSNTKPNNYGVRIYNGQDLTQTVSGRTMKGLSVVSDQAIYTKGNYNCGPDDAKCINTDLDDDQRKPAAIMADTVNVLSNAWPLDDSWSKNLISTKNGTPVTAKGRPASETTVNAAFLAGIDISGGVNRGGQDGGYATAGGGLNNYPRFHEDWSNGNDTSLPKTPLHYQGSMVSLGAPRKVNGAFCGSGSTGDCNIYNPPLRNWRYDPLFNNAANLPPMSPRAVYLKQELFSRNFDQAALPFTNLLAMLSPSRVLSTLTALIQTHP